MRREQGRWMKGIGTVLVSALLWWGMIELLPEQVKQQLADRSASQVVAPRKNEKHTPAVASPRAEQVTLMPRIVEPSPRKVPEPKPPKNKLSPKPLAVASAEARAAGAKALRSANMPALLGDIAVPFAGYLAHVERQGAVLAVFDQQRNRVVGHIEGGRFSSTVQLGQYALRTRDVTSDIPAGQRREYLRKTEAVVGKGVYRFLILMPEAYEQKFIGTLALLLKKQGLRFDDVDAIHYRYRRTGKRLLLEVLSVEREAKRIPIHRSSYL